jgi:hypothetical protein
MSLLLGPGATSAALDLVNLGTDWSDGERLFGFESQNAAGKKLEIRLGKTSAPDEGNRPNAVFSRVLKTPESSFSGDGAGNLAALRAHTTAVAGSEGQAIGAVGSAISFSKYEEGNSLADAVGLYGLGIVKGESTRTGLGVFANGRRDTATGRTCGIECVSNNQPEGAAEAWVEGNYPSTKGIHLHAVGASQSAVGLFTSNVGVGYHTFIGGMKGAPISNAFYRDETEAPYSIRIRGKHATAAIAVNSGAGGMIIGGETLASAGCLLEVFGGAEVKDPLYQFRVTGTKGMRGHLAGDTGALLTAFCSGGASQFVTGSVAKDVGFQFLAGTNFFLAPTGKTAVLRAAEAKLGFFGTAPVAKPNVKAAAEVTAKELCEALETLGLVE